VEGRPIYRSEYGKGDSVVLILGSLHGDEEVGGLLVVRLAEFLSSGDRQKGNRRIVFVPVVNPDGVYAGRRWNAHGVDINRNFPTDNWQRNDRNGQARHGQAPASEPETRLMMELIGHYKPGLIIALHSPLHVVNYDGPAREIAEEMGKRNGYPVSGTIGYSTPGSLGTYAGVERGIPIITLELPQVDVEEAWEQNRSALLYVLGM
jgi:protein MpaA